MGSGLRLFFSNAHTSFDSSSASFHARLADLLRRYDVNDDAASVRVFAMKPGYGKNQ